jgi:hypothetical protein
MASDSVSSSTRRFATAARIWFVTDGTAEQQGWQTPLVDSLVRCGAGQIDVFSTPRALAETARGLLEQGTALLARTFRVSGSDEAVDAAELMQRHRPDLILVDHPGVLRLLELVRDATRSTALHLGVVGGWDDVDAWQGSRADAVVVPDDDQGWALRRSGLPEAALRVAGPPAPAGFAPQEPATILQFRQGLGIQPGEPVVLIDATRMTPTLAEALLSAFAGKPLPHLLVHYGRHRLVADAFRTWADHFRIRARMFGWVPDLDRYASAADLVLTTPESLHLSGYLSLGLPVVTIQGEVDPLQPVVQGAIVPCADARAAAGVVGFVAASGVAPEHAHAASAFAAAWLASDPTSAVASAVVSLWEQRSMLLSRVRAPGPAQAGVAPVVPVESIGTGHLDPQKQDLSVPLPREQAREQLANLILEERKLESHISQISVERDRWMERLELARQAGDTRLGDAAQTQLDQFVRQVADANERMASLERQKDLVRRRVAAPKIESSSAQNAALSMEDEFRRLERERDLSRLRSQEGDA